MANRLIVIAFLLSLASVKSFAQLTGIKTIPGDYATVAAAVTALNTNGVGAGGVTFNVAAGHTETGNMILTATGIAGNPIIFQKSGVGANPTITAGVGTFLDAIFEMRGSDYITIDGLTFLENSANTTYQENTEYAIAFRKPNNNNGCQYNTIKNCTISLNRTYTYEHPTYFRIFQAHGIHFNHGTDATQFGFLAPSTLPSGGHSNNLIQNNTINNVTYGIWVRTNQNTTTIDLIDHDNQFLNNTISDIGGHPFGAGGIYIYTAANTTISGNNITTHITHTGTLNGIYAAAQGKSGITVTNNTIQINSFYVNGNPNFVKYAIQVLGNTETAAANAFGNLTLISNNTILAGNSRGGYDGIHANYVDNLRIENNNIQFSSDVLTVGSSNGISISSGFNTNPTQIIKKNIIANSMGTGNASNPHNVTGISVAGVSVANLIDSNKILNNNAFQFTGIFSFAENATVTNNIVACGTSNFVERFNGMQIASNGLLCMNNYIGCTANSPSSNTIHYGMNILGNTSATPRKIYNNTVYLAGGGTINNSTALVNNGVATGPTDLRNNIFVNNMNPGTTTGKVFAFNNSATVPTSGLFAKNNLFYAGIPSSKNAIYSNGSILTPNYIDSTLELYKLRVCAKDINSVTENPPFLSLDYTNPNYLHINPAVASLVNGRGFATAEVTVDYDGDTRNATTPDIGADELNGIDGVLTTPLTAPVLWLKADAGAYTDAGTTLATNNQTIQQWNDQSCSGFNATQADVSKRPTLHQYAFNGKPALWFDGANGNYFLNNITSNPVVAGGERTVFVYGKRDCNIHAGGGVGGTLFTFRRTPLINTLTYGANTYGTPVYIYSDANGVGNNNASIASAMIDTALNQFTITYKVPAAGSQISCYINGLGQTVNQAGGAVVAETGTNGFTVGHREDQPDLDWSGWIAEVIVYDRVLTDGERIAVENYLQTKYGKTALPPQFTGLPATNPYSSNIDVQDAAWRHSYNSGDNSKIIASVKANCFDLGTVNGIVYNDATAGQFNGQRYMRRHYVINSTLDPAGTKRVRLYYTNADFADLQTYIPSLTAASQLAVTKYDGTNEDGVYDPSGGVSVIILSSQITTGTVFGVNYLEFDITGFSEFWIHTGFAPLPLNFISFSVQKCTGNTVCLNWQTANEQNVSHFEIQRSVDGRTYTAVVTKAANNQATNFYSTTDDIASLQNSGQIYYRIKQIDADGRFSYTNVQLVKLTDKLTISIYPNPASDVINIVGWNTIKQMQLYNVSGRKVAGWQTAQPTININNLNSGTYILKMELKTGEVLKQKIIVNK